MIFKPTYFSLGTGVARICLGSSSTKWEPTLDRTLHHLRHTLTTHTHAGTM